jgi:hypothetical protein
MLQLELNASPRSGDHETNGEGPFLTMMVVAENAALCCTRQLTRRDQELTFDGPSGSIVRFSRADALCELIARAIAEVSGLSGRAARIRMKWDRNSIRVSGGNELELTDLRLHPDTVLAILAEKLGVSTELVWEQGIGPTLTIGLGRLGGRVDADAPHDSVAARAADLAARYGGYISEPTTEGITPPSAPRRSPG